MIEDRNYKKEEVIYFYKTDEKFGLLSNMKGRIHLRVNDIDFFSSESIYQSLKHPFNIDFQRMIAKEKSPLISKHIAQKYKAYIRNDWEQVKNNIMRITLQIKYLQNIDFKKLLLESTGKEIVEISRKDNYWGTLITDENFIIGKNVLGRLLMELREEANNNLVEKHFVYLINNVTDLLINGKAVSLENTIKFTSNNEFTLTNGMSPFAG